MVRKIAILGGGASSLFAAWELVKANPTAYDITVYQVGWRLGGKGASGRREGDNRIEEHGLHLMFGFYENVFRVVREAYSAAYGDPDMWKRFFDSKDTAVSMIKYLDRERARWEAWNVPYPDSDEGALPGDGGDVDVSVKRILQNMWKWFLAVAKSGAGNNNLDLDSIVGDGPSEQLTLDEVRALIDSLDDPPTNEQLFAVAGSKKNPLLDVVGWLIPDYWSIARLFLERLDGALADPAGDSRLFEILLDGAIDMIGRFVPAGLREMLRFVTAIARGVFRDLFLKGSRNWFDLDEYDLRAWIARHGGDPVAPSVDGLYDAVFGAYSQLGAGSILQSALKAAFLFRGGAVYKMQAGMGDTIFTPLYLALKAKGVKFAFFHRVVKLTTGADAETVETIEFERQVAAEAVNNYDPLREVEVDLKGVLRLKCWPSEPIWSRIAEPERTRVRNGSNLENYWTPPDHTRRFAIRRVDGDAADGEFNDVILGISVAALPDICEDLLAVDPPFARHVDYLAKASTATQAMQLWTVPGKHPEQPNPIIVPNGTPYDTIADMSHLLRAESHAPGLVDGVFYLCSALLESSPPSPRSATEYPKALLAAAVQNGRDWVETRAPVLWRNLATPEGFNWDALYDPDRRIGPARFDAQYVNTPLNLSDRYVLSPPMTYRHRLKANGTRFANLYLTGDWIQTSLSIGCLEAAAMAGIQTARAITVEHRLVQHELREVPRAIGDWITDVKARLPRGDVAHGRIAGSAPPYRRRDSELIVQPPYQLDCDSLFLFVLAANKQKLQALCDRELNLGPQKYSPLGDYVVLYGAKLKNLSMGTTCLSNEVGIWVPVQRADDGGLRTYSPYLWIDSATSAFSGRSIYGYPKQLASVLVPEVGAPSEIRVIGDALISASDHGPWRIEPSPLLTVVPDSAGPWTPPAQGLGAFRDLAKFIASTVGLGPGRLISMLQGMKSVFLKQLPHVNATDASYQAIIEAEILPAFDTVRGKVLGTKWTVTIPAYHAPNIVDELGLDAIFRFDRELRRMAMIQSVAQVWMQFEARLDPGEVIWRAEIP